MESRFVKVAEIKRMGSANGKGSYKTIEALYVPRANYQEKKQIIQLKLF